MDNIDGEWMISMISETFSSLWASTSHLFTVKWIATNCVVWLLHVLLLKEKVGKKRTLLSLIVQEMFVVYIGFNAPPDSPVNVIFLWVSVFIYEKLLGEKLEIRDNFSFASDLPSRFYEDVDFIKPSDDTQTVRTDLKCLVVVRKGHSLPKGSLPLDLICSVHDEVLDDILVQNLHKMGFQVNSCFQVTTDDEKKQSLDFVLVASSHELKLKWVELLKNWVGITDEDLDKLWLRKLLSITEEEALLRDFKIEDAQMVMDRAERHVNPSYLVHSFESVAQVNQKSTKLKQLGQLPNSLKIKIWKEEKIESKVQLQWNKFVEFFKIISTPAAVEPAFKRLPRKRKKMNSLSAKMFQYFLQEVQRDALEAENYLNKISVIEPVLQYSNLSLLGFSNYLLEESQLVFDDQLLDSMDHPLSHYYIASSHNTYLTKDQLKSKSSVDMYIKALQRGCKCLELDCWDGSDNEPVIYHGYTLTSKILFKDVITAIREYAFCRSPYPVILSFEIHCSIEQQKVMAKHLREILGDMLYLKSMPLDEKCLPSPNELSGYIIIKSKKIAEGLEEGSMDDFEADFSDDEVELDEFNVLKELQNVKETDISDIISIGSLSDDEEANGGKEIKQDKIQALLSEVQPNIGQKQKNKKLLKIAKEMSDLVVYCQAKRFKNFDHSKSEDNYFEMSSFQEKKAMKLSREGGVKFIEYNRNQLSRIYPSGYRIDSSNYNPIQFWNVGCQLVALNYQTACKEMQLNQGLFQRNGGCGYVLKPEFLREISSFDPQVPPKSYRTISIRIIGGHQLPFKHPSSVRSERSYQVQIRIFGVDADIQQQQTIPVKNNGMNPLWDELFLFKIHVPDLAIVMFTVCSKSFIAQYSLPVKALKRGCRRVPLLNKHSEPIQESFLLVHIEQL